jgi:neutral ceramidase
MNNQNSKFDDYLAAGAAVMDITPPLDVGLLMSSVEARWQPFEGVRKPLLARALVLESLPQSMLSGQRQRTAIISLDMLALSSKALGGFPDFKEQICVAADNVISPDEIVLACTHTHTAPESGAITELHHTPSFKKWINQLTRQIGQAILGALEALAPCQLYYGSSIAKGLGIHRRYKTTRGIMMSYPEPPPEIVLSREGSVDDSVNVVAFRQLDGRSIAILTNATCHPVYEMCNPQISSDYPGELCSLLEERNSGAIALFLNGAAGNINPRGVSAGARAARTHAERLAEAVGLAISTSIRVSCSNVVIQRSSVELPTRLPGGINVGRSLMADIVGIAIGEIGLLFLPGEPFVETGLALRRHSPFEFTIVAGFSEETVGYIPTDEAFSEGGYEVSFGPWSVLAPTSEETLRRGAIKLLHELQAKSGGGSIERVVPAPHVFGPRSKPIAKG